MRNIACRAVFVCFCHVCFRHINQRIYLSFVTNTQPNVVLAGITNEPDTSRLCPKCGMKTRSGKLSCCSREGAWYNKCGDPGNTSFQYTWLEGVQACESSCQMLTSFCLRILDAILLMRTPAQRGLKTNKKNPQRRLLQLAETKSVLGVATSRT